jgi:UDP:flavonoid glycosyltransferase YjiC (YdhE family)
MKVLFCGRPAYGHLYPLIPLAMAFQSRGDEVSFATGDKFVPRLEALGFAAYPVGRSILWAEEEAIRRHPGFEKLTGPDKAHLGAAMFSEMLPPKTVDDLLPLIARINPHMVIYEQADFGAYLAASLAGIPAAIHSYGAPWPQFMSEKMVPNLRRLWQSHGVSDPPDDPMHGNIYLDISPPSLGDAAQLGLAHRIVLRPVPFAEPVGELPGWVEGNRDRPTVYMTLGTVVYERVDVFRAVAEGLGRLDIEALVAVGPDGDVGALGPLPPNVRAELFVPQDRLFPFVDVIVHHCGSGTMLGGLSNGIPQLAIPQGADQFLNAAALAGAGAGIPLMPDEITPERVAAGVTSLLDEPTFKQQAQRIQSEIQAMPSPSEVAQLLAGLA